MSVSIEMKVLGVVLDRSLTFEKHVTMVARSCYYHAKAIRHIRHLLSTELVASTLARSLILTKLTTVIHCFTAHITAVSRHYSACRTKPLWLFCKHRGGATQTRYCVPKNGHPFNFGDYSVCCWSIFKLFGNIAAKEICKTTHISKFILMRGIWL